MSERPKLDYQTPDQRHPTRISIGLRLLTFVAVVAVVILILCAAFWLYGMQQLGRP